MATDAPPSPASPTTFDEVAARLDDVLAELKAVKALVGRPPPHLLRAGDAAALLGMSRRTFDDAWKAGRLPQPVSTPGGQRWKRKQLELYADRLLSGRRTRARQTKPRPADAGGGRSAR